MKHILIAVAAVAVLASGGCNSSAPADEGTVKPGAGVVQNPGGKPKTAEDAKLANEMQQTGQAMNAQRDKDAMAMAAARARAGAK